jgi:hypothetical protein
VPASNIENISEYFKERPVLAWGFVALRAKNERMTHGGGVGWGLACHDTEKKEGAVLVNQKKGASAGAGGCRRRKSKKARSWLGERKQSAPRC